MKLPFGLRLVGGVMPDTRIVCNNCFFYAASGLSQGECRFHAPLLVLGQIDVSTKKDDKSKAAFPIVTSGQWCGSFSNVTRHAGPGVM